VGKAKSEKLIYSMAWRTKERDVMYNPVPGYIFRDYIYSLRKSRRLSRPRLRKEMEVKRLPHRRHCFPIPGIRDQTYFE
jgi:hypothetical protein